MPYMNASYIYIRIGHVAIAKHVCMQIIFKIIGSYVAYIILYKYIAKNITSLTSFSNAPSIPTLILADVLKCSLNPLSLAMEAPS